MHVNGQSLLTWMHIIPQHSNASERELFKRDALVSRVDVSRTEEACFIHSSSLGFLH